VILKAVLAHLYFEWIHPFGDGNGRTGRPIEFHILVSAGVPFPAAHLLSNHYNQTRSEYYRQLHRASATGGDVLPFIRYAVQGFVDGLRGQMENVRAERMDVIWVNYVHQMVPGATSTAERRRTLVFALTAEDQPLIRRELMDFTSEVREAYRKKTPKTLSRDLNFLRDKGLIDVRDRGWVANKGLMRAFLPDAVAVER
jgi:DNA-binding transcriptional ArsR family regulator